MKPNIIIVMADQQRADIRKSRGFSLDTTPFLDKWSEGAVDFQKAYTPNPICMSARISMFTGRYASAHRTRTNHNVKDVLYTKDLIQTLSENGYKTALCGKNHSHLKEEDFDFCESNGHLETNSYDKQSQEDLDFVDFLQRTNFVMSKKPAPGGVEVQFPYKNVTSALKFIDSLEEDTPFFTWVSFAEPHNPYQVPEEYFDLFPLESLPKCSNEKYVMEKGDRFVRMSKVWKEIHKENITQELLRCRSNYYGMIRLIDDQFKRLIEGLAERNLQDNTIVIYLSDHGDFAGEYGLMRKGCDLSNILSNIPMVWKGCGITNTGKDEEHYVSIVDIFPTICDLLNLPVPLGVQGKSIVPILQNIKGFEKEFECAYLESGFSGLYWDDDDNLSYQQEGATKNMTTFDCLNTWTQCGQVRALCFQGYRLQIDMMQNGYLYNLEKDPMELVNLWDNPDYTMIKLNLLEKLMAVSLQNSDVLPLPHNRYRVKIHPKGYWYQNYHSDDTKVIDLKPMGNNFID